MAKKIAHHLSAAAFMISAATSVAFANPNFPSCAKDAVLSQNMGPKNSERAFLALQNLICRREDNEKEKFKAALKPLAPGDNLKPVIYSFLQTTLNVCATKVKDAMAETGKNESHPERAMTFPTPSISDIASTIFALGMEFDEKGQIITINPAAESQEFASALSELAPNSSLDFEPYFTLNINDNPDFDLTVKFATANAKKVLLLSLSEQQEKMGGLKFLIAQETDDPACTKTLLAGFKLTLNILRVIVNAKETPVALLLTNSRLKTGALKFAAQRCDI